MKLIKISVLTTPTTTNVERQFSVFNSFDKLMQLISMKPLIYDLDMVK